MQLKIGDMTVDVVLKDIRNVHLSVVPPAGRVRISAPLRMSMDTIRVFAVSKLVWIRQQQRKFLEQERETPREYLNRESHYLWGKRYLLKVVEQDAPPQVAVRHSQIRLQVRPGTGADRRRDIMEAWRREQLKAAARSVIVRWEPLIGVKVARLHVQRMKTKWGGCNSRGGSIRLNTDLVKKPPECLEYIVVHEMAHLLEPTHNARFVALMDRLMPKWRFFRDQLNRLPVRHEDWAY